MRKQCRVIRRRRLFSACIQERHRAFWEYDRLPADYYSQPGALFRLLTQPRRQILFANTARAMGDIARHIKERHIANCAKADPAYGGGVVKSRAEGSASHWRQIRAGAPSAGPRDGAEAPARPRETVSHLSHIGTTDR